MRKRKSVQLGLFVAASLILALQAGASRALKIDETRIGIPGLHSISWDLGPWKSAGEGSIGADVAAYLKPDEYILRDYVNQQNGRTVNLFVAYFKSLQNSHGPHSPKICLPGSGWLVSSYKIDHITIPGRAEPIPVNEFTMTQGDQNIAVLYWYQNAKDIWAEEYRAKLLLLPNLIRYHRSDESLVRVITPYQGFNANAGISSCINFTRTIFPVLAKHFASVSTG